MNQIHTSIYGLKFNQLVIYFSSNIDEFRLAFQQGCPKFLSPTTVVYEGPNQAKVNFHTDRFVDSAIVFLQ